MASGDESSTLGVLPASAGLPVLQPSGGRFPLLYQLIRASCAPALRPLFGLVVMGLERLPQTG
jgi:hypothetical protein